MDDYDFSEVHKWSPPESPHSEFVTDFDIQKPSRPQSVLESNSFVESTKFELEDLFNESLHPYFLKPEGPESPRLFIDSLSLSDDLGQVDDADHFLSSPPNPPTLKLFPSLITTCQILNAEVISEDSDEFQMLSQSERVLLDLCLMQRHKSPLRKEQMYRRVILICLRLIAHDFEIEHYIFNKIPRKMLKVEMLKYFFKDDPSPFVSKHGDNPFNPNYERADLANINFSKAVMSKIAKCNELRVKIFQKIDVIKQMADSFFQRQVFKFLSECENWVTKYSPESPVHGLEMLFSFKNSSGKNHGVHVPWSVSQLTQGCDVTASKLQALASR
jgi:hypothetical protein